MPPNFPITLQMVKPFKTTVFYFLRALSNRVLGESFWWSGSRAVDGAILEGHSLVWGGLTPNHKCGGVEPLPNLLMLPVDIIRDGSSSSTG